MHSSGDLKQGKETKLHNYPIIKCAPGEMILCAQREHPVAFMFAMAVRLATEIFIFISFFFVVYSTLSLTTLFLDKKTIILLGTIVGLSTILLIELYAFLSWYYQFYIVTNKAIVHKRFFRISGFYSEVIFLEQIHQQEIDRSPSNLLYDYLRIENITVRFHKLEREDPFFFKSPENAQEIEDAIQNVTVQAGPTKKND